LIGCSFLSNPAGNPEDGLIRLMSPVGTALVLALVARVRTNGFTVRQLLFWRHCVPLSGKFLRYYFDPGDGD